MHIEMVVVVQMFIYRYTAKMHLSMMVDYHYIHVKTLDLSVFISHQIRSLRNKR